MKLLLLSFYFPPDLCAGSFRTEALVKALVGQMPVDSHVDVLTTMPNRYASFSVEAKKSETFQGYSVYRMTIPKHKSGMVDQSISFISYLMGCLKFVKDKKYDFIIATSSRLMTSFLGALISRKKGIPVYLDIRDIYVEVIHDILDPKLAFFVMPFFKAIEKFSFSQAETINLVSPGFKQYITEKYPKKRLKFFTNGIDNEFINIKLDKNQIKSKRIQVLYAGNIGEGQGLHLIIPRLAKKMENIADFTVIGDGGRIQELKNAIRSEKCDNVLIRPPVTREKLIREYLKSDVLFMHLNKQKSFESVLPSKIFEYAALDKPIWAGVSGYAAKFIAQEIDNAQVFSPCNIDEAIQSFHSLDIDRIPRKDFIEKYSRVNIMRAMSKDIWGLVLRDNDDPVSDSTYWCMLKN